MTRHSSSVRIQAAKAMLPPGSSCANSAVASRKPRWRETRAARSHQPATASVNAPAGCGVAVSNSVAKRRRPSSTKMPSTSLLRKAGQIHSAGETVPQPIQESWRRSWWRSARNASGIENEMRHHGSPSPIWRKV